MPLCDSIVCYVSMGRSDAVDYRYLAKTKGQSISIASTYIVFVTKMQKRQTSERSLPLLKNDIPNNLKPQKPVVYCSDHNP